MTLITNPNFITNSTIPNPKPIIMYIEAKVCYKKLPDNAIKALNAYHENLNDNHSQDTKK